MERLFDRKLQQPSLAAQLGVIDTNHEQLSPQQQSPQALPASEPLAVRLYGEQDLILAEARKRPGGVPKLIADLRAAAGPREREQKVRDALHDIGFERFAYGVFAQHNDSVKVRSFFTTYMQPAWVQRFVSERYPEVDPRHHEETCSGLPLVWDVQDLRASVVARSGNVRGCRFVDDLDDHGMRCGVFFKLPSPTQPSERTVISLMSSRPDRRWIDDGVVGRALTFGLYMHEFLTRHVQIRENGSAKRQGLSPLQQDIMECLVRGQSDKAIAYQLDLSPHTVDYHLRQLRRRFGARNRVQLVIASAQAASKNFVQNESSPVAMAKTTSEYC